MTSPAATPLRRPTREQLVAALLVGTVVVLLGFASGLGLGLGPATVPAARSGPAGGPAPMTPAIAGSAAVPATTAPPPVAYVVEPVPPATPAVAVAAPPAPASSPPASSPATPGPSTDSPPDPPSPTAPAPPTCSPSLLTGLLNLLLPNPSASGGGLLGIGALLTVIGDIERTAGTLLSASPGRLLEQVTGLLGRPGVMSPGSLVPGAAPAALAQSCTTDVGRALRLVAAGQGVSNAVRAVGR